MKTFIVGISPIPHQLPYVANVFHLFDVALFAHKKNSPSYVHGNKWTSEDEKETPIFNNGYRARRSVATWNKLKIFSLHSASSLLLVFAAFVILVLDENVITTNTLIQLRKRRRVLEKEKPSVASFIFYHADTLNKYFITELTNKKNNATRFWEYLRNVFFFWLGVNRVEATIWIFFGR